MIRIPPLKNGDRLTRLEFERRYEAMPDLKKAELIEGVVFIPRGHGRFDLGLGRADIGAWAGLFTYSTPGVSFGANVTVKMDDENEPQPDYAAYTLPNE